MAEGSKLGFRGHCISDMGVVDPAVGFQQSSPDLRTLFMLAAAHVEGLHE